MIDKTPHSAKGRFCGITISDGGVFVATLCIILISGIFPLFQVLAETIQQDRSGSLEMRIQNRDYTVLLSSLFGRVGQTVPESAHTYIRGIDEYRMRIAQGIEENGELTQVLRALVQNYPKRLADGYLEEIEQIEDQVQQHRSTIEPYIESDVFLSDATVVEYNLYPSIIDRLIMEVNRDTGVEDLSQIRIDSYNLRRDITILYSRVRDVMRPIR